MQMELQKEFNKLIKEVSKEVLELSVSKSMESASFTVKEQVPSLNKNIEHLQRVVDSLKAVNAENLKHQQDAKKRENIIDHKLGDISQKIDKDMKKGEERQKIFTDFKDSLFKKLLTQEKAVKYNEELINKNTNKLDEKILSLNELTTEGVLTGITTKKLLIWTLVFSIGSFCALTTLLLHTMNIISL